MDYKEANRLVYNNNAEEFEKRTKDYIRNYILDDAELFIKSLQGKRILDLGSGPGRDSQFFKERGLNPLCLDFSPEMVRLCQERGLEAQVGDLENLPFEDFIFDGVWAYTSLLHMPKSKLNPVLGKIRNILKQEGVFYLGMKEGDFEGWIESDKYPGSKRFFALYSDKELRKTLTLNFDIMHTSRVPLGDAIFLNYLCRKNNP